jgi:hypothetical protein
MTEKGNIYPMQAVLSSRKNKSRIFLQFRLVFRRKTGTTAANAIISSGFPTLPNITHTLRRKPDANALTVLMKKKYGLLLGL